jgi:holliday junction DNA helicase RuvA
MTNDDIARRLRERAAELARGGDNLYRVRAFRQAALAVLTLPEPVETILSVRGPDGLKQVPGIGRSLAETIAGIAKAA